ncbi:MAG: hypothetical protein FJ344_01415 [Sphingomonadales bacterium]|nr:hypothetical protein [Sphingomonadales bacterium]
MQQLINAFRDWDRDPKPFTIHISTHKGKGFSPTEEEQTRWHAPGRFDKVSGKSLPEPERSGPKFQDVFGQTLLELAQGDHRVVGTTAAIPSGTSLKIMMD